MMSEVEELQVRIAHQEAAIEALTRALLCQENRVAELERSLGRLAAMVRALEREQPGGTTPDTEIPPHY